MYEGGQSDPIDDDWRSSSAIPSFQEKLSPEQRIVRCTAAAETAVSHVRAMTLCDLHPVDLTRMLQGLVQKGYLAKIGQGRGSRYHLPGVPLAGSTDPFGPELFSQPPDLAGQPSDLAAKPPDLTAQPSDLAAKPSDLAAQPPDLAAKPPDLTAQPSDLAAQPPDLAAKPSDLAAKPSDLAAKPPPSSGRRIPDLDRPLIDSLDQIDAVSLSRLSRISDRIGDGRVPRNLMVSAIAELCEGRYVTLRVLARLLERSENYLRQAYLNPLVREGGLTLAFPQSPNDPRQAYTAPDPTDVP